MTIPPPRARWPFPILMLSTFGLGTLRPAPGTWGSIPPVLLAAALMLLGFGPGTILYTVVLLAVLIVFSASCIAFGERGEARFGKKDASEIVADETAGQCIPLLLLPTATLATPTLAIFSLVFAFLAFRIFDIIKLWPADSLQRLPGGWGVLIDDLIAGVHAAVLIWVLAWVVL